MTSRLFTALAATGALSMWAPVCMAQSSVPNTKMSATDSTAQERRARTIVVSASAMPKAISDVPLQVKVLDRNDIDDRSATSLPDLLRTEAGIQLATDNVLGTALSMNGVGGENIKVLIDGVPMVGRLDGNLDLTQIALDNVERVEIINGPMSAQYGTNALGGTINLVTQRSSTTTASATLRAESAGTVNTLATVATDVGPVNVRMVGGRMLFAGWRDPAENRSRSFSWRPREQYTADADAAIAVGSSHVRLSTRLYTDLILDRGEPRQPYGEQAFDTRFRTTRWLHTLVARTPLTDSGTFLSTTASIATFERRRTAVVKDLVTLAERPTGDPSSIDTNTAVALTLRSVATTHPFEGISADVGLDLLHESVGGSRLRIAHPTMTDLAAFAVADVTIAPWLLLQPAARWAWNSSYGAPFTPSLAIRIGNESLVAKASVSRGFRAPSLRELHLDFVDVNHDIQGYSDLAAEQSISSRASLTWFPDAFTNGIMRLEPAVFSNAITNMITLVQTDGTQFSYRNVGTFTSYGVLLEGGLAFPSVELTVQVSHILRSSMVDASLPLLGASELAAMASWTPDGTALRMAASWKFTGAVPVLVATNDGAISEQHIDGFHMMDVTLSYPVLSWLRTSASVRNLFDVRTINAVNTDVAHSGNGSQRIAFGRSVMLTMEIIP